MASLATLRTLWAPNTLLSEPLVPLVPLAPASVGLGGYVRSYVAGRCKSVAAIHRAKIDLILWSSH